MYALRLSSLTKEVRGVGSIGKEKQKWKKHEFCTVSQESVIEIKIITSYTNEASVITLDVCIIKHKRNSCLI